MQYWSGWIVFAGISSFIVADTVNFWRNLRRQASLPSLGSELGRLILLGGLASIGYLVASETFQRSNDWVRFLATGVMGALLIRILLSLKSAKD